MIVITVFGAPVAKGRPRFARRGNFVATYTPEKTRVYENLLAIEGKVAMQGQKPVRAPLKVKLWAFFPVPKSTNKKNKADMLANIIKHTKKPDCDNLGKVLDALNGIVWEDDSQIVELSIVKGYSEKPRMLIECITLED